MFICNDSIHLYACEYIHKCNKLMKGRGNYERERDKVISGGGRDRERYFGIKRSFTN